MAKLLGSFLVALFSLACKKPAQPPPPPPAVEVAAAIQRDVPVTKEWIGLLEGLVNADIRPQVTGYVMKLAYAEGSLVHRGDVLFEIDPRQFRAALDQAKGVLAQNEAALGKARLDVARFTTLAAKGIVSQQDLDNATSAERQARANVDAARAAAEQAELNLEWSKVRSPIDGIAGIARSQVGDLVNGQTTMTTVSAVDPIKVYFSLSEREYLASAEKTGPMDARRGTPPQDKGTLTLILADGRVYPFRGDQMLADRNVDLKTGTMLVEGVFPNPQRLLRPGQYAKVRASTDVRKGAVLVPQRAVTELQGIQQVAVVGPDDTVEIRAVTTGDRIDSLWVIEKGLRAGERVVVEGLQKVRPGMRVDPRPAPEAVAATAETAAGS
jgi:RND family efflux transporter MFP subunit